MNLLSINLTHSTMNSSQYALKTSIVNIDTSRKTVTPLTDGCNNSRILVQFSLFDCFSGAICHYCVSGKCATQASLKVCLEWT